MNAAAIAKAPSALTLIPQKVTCSLGGFDMAQLSIEIFRELRGDLDVWDQA
jgi:hypothetical protein